ncbi:hypothetical protein QJS04_geneDACA023541 [Acorus gramineus]|uniref:CCHC-type domain-containing protein n=1 Tax=Acorus gramineus TaxID=55184 RepID=A0AAV9A318_ACOGR|nr:hypothetical protein QJS04_geneDACA023541 [Acorus gramineus]
MYDTFMRMAPPLFYGTTDPMIAEEWLFLLEKTFRAIKCQEEDRVPLTLFRLAGDAELWWRMVERTQTSSITWERFVQLFNEKYFPEAVRREKEQKFLYLQQGGRSVAEYDAEFTRLSRFGAHVLRDEEARARRFERGLRPEIRISLIALKFPTYALVLERALLLEQNLAEIERARIPQGGSAMTGTEQLRGAGGPIRHGHQPRGRGDQQQYDRHPLQQQRTQESGHGRDDRRSTVCYVCGRTGHLARNCWQNRPKVCFTCGHEGHMARQCSQTAKIPATQSQGSTVAVDTQKQPAQGIVYTVMEQNAHATRDVVRGTLMTSQSVTSR